MESELDKTKIDPVEEVKELRALCEKYKLEHRDILDKYSDEELAEIYNGIGPSTFPEWMRESLDSLHPSLKPVAFIHDVEWQESDGTEESFTESNDRFRRNGVSVSSQAFSWYHPRRYLVMLEAVEFAYLCQWFGWSVWKNSNTKFAKSEKLVAPH